MTQDLLAENEIKRLASLANGLKNCRNDRERIELLNCDPRVEEWLRNPSWLRAFSSALSQECELIIKSLVAIGQDVHLIPSHIEEAVFSEKLRLMLEELSPVETFYKEIGGIIGYHWVLSSFISQKNENTSQRCGYYHRPPGIDISVENDSVRDYVLSGLIALPYLAEIYPVGGAADRLKLYDLESGQPLPAAKLIFCGYSLLEGLVRDLQAREYLYFKLFGEQVITPLAMMTSSEKDNHHHITSLCEQKQWFGRSKTSFRFFCQPVVPTVDKEGKWFMSAPGRLMMKPGGHGVLWKIAQQEGVFDWLQSLGREKVLIRQINNPIAGADFGLLAFCGVGFRENKGFGFASCPRHIQSAEGVNILIEKKLPTHTSYCLTNIEYCDFFKLSIKDTPMEIGSHYSQFPSNTNILFADIAVIKDKVKDCPIPGMLANLKSVSYLDEEGHLRSQEVARLESTMQNIADCFEELASSSTPVTDLKLGTYLTYNHRRKTISTAKKLLHEESSLLETPEGCLYDLLQNAHDLLTHHCQMCIPDVPSIEVYLRQGPSFLFHFHPALGPLYSIIAQKVQGGSFGYQSELKLEIAEVEIINLKLDGSLHITADQIMGEINEGILNYSERVGRCRLINVSVQNRGYDSTASNLYWKGDLRRLESCEIVIHGTGEFYAENVVLRGNIKIEVDYGTRVIAYEESGVLCFKTENLSDSISNWIYCLTEESRIELKKT